MPKSSVQRVEANDVRALESSPNPEDLERILQHIPVGIVYIDRDFRILHANAYYEKKFSRKLKHDKGRRCYEIRAEMRKEKDKVLKPCGSCLAVEAMAKGEVRTFVMEATPDLILENTTIPVKDESGKIIGAIELLQDITEKARIEKQLKEYSERLEEKVEGKSKELSLLQKVNHLLNSGAEPEDVYTVIALGLTRIFQYCVGAIYILDESGKHLTCKAYDADSVLTKKIERLTGLTALNYSAPLLRDSVLTRIVETKKPLITKDIAEVIKSHTDKAPLRALSETIARISGVEWGVGVPLVVGGRVIGIIGAGSLEELTDEDANRLSYFGDQVAMALEKSRLGKVLEEKVRERTLEIRHQKELMELITEGIEEGLLLLSKDRRIKWANRKLKEMSGYSNKEILGKHCYEVTHKSDHKCEPPLDACPIDILSKTGEPATEVHVHYDKDGKTSFVEVSAYPLREDGEVTGYIHLTRDVTERKKIEEALRESEERFRRLSEATFEGIVIHENGRILDSNQTLATMFGYELSELIGMNGLELVVPESREILSKNISSGYEKPYEAVGLKKDGTTFPIEIRGKNIHYQGRTCRMGAVRDISERKKAEEKLKMISEFNENIVKSMQEGILIEDDEGYVTFANPRMLQMLGRPKEDVIGRHWTEIFSSNSKKRVEEENARLKIGESSRYEAVLNLGEREMDVMVSAAPLREGKLYVGNLKIFVDITERKEAEERLRHKALRYKIEKGRCYLVTEKSLDKGLDVFLDLLQAGYDGMVISRNPPEELIERVGREIKVLYLSEKSKGEGAIPPQINIVRKSIEDFLTRNSVILLDRLDYLIVQNDFNTVLKLLNGLTEMTYAVGANLLVVIDPDTLSEHEFSLLEKEFSRVEAKQKIQIDEELLEILRFVKREFDQGRTPVHKDVAKSFGITRPTAVKRLKELKNKGLLADKKRGRFKVLELTERGREMV